MSLHLPTYFSPFLNFQISPCIHTPDSFSTSSSLLFLLYNFYIFCMINFLPIHKQTRIILSLSYFFPLFPLLILSSLSFSAKFLENLVYNTYLHILTSQPLFRFLQLGLCHHSTETFSRSSVILL